MVLLLPGSYPFRGSGVATVPGSPRVFDTLLWCRPPSPPSGSDFAASRISKFTESVIREMTRLALQPRRHQPGPGLSRFSRARRRSSRPPREAIDADINQYAITWGAKPFRDAIAAKYRRTYGMEFDPEREITVCCGATEGMIASLLAVLDPGDEVVLFEPFYENYGPDTQLCGAEPRYVTLHAPDWTFDPDELRRAFTPRTKAIILNTPNNPTGKVFTREELEFIAGLCQEFDALAITDEIYEHILYDGAVAHPDLLAAGHARALDPGQQHEQDVLGDRLAGRLGAGAARSDRFHSQGPRLPDGRRRRPAAAGRRDGALLGRRLLRGSFRAEYAGTARPHGGDPGISAGSAAFVPQGAYYVMTDISGLRFRRTTSLLSVT